jgi:uncharacterized OsmC-like protein
MTDEMLVKREIVMEADVESVERLRKEGHVRGFTVYCDEQQRTGGDNSAPSPMGYFALSVGF